MRISDWSSDVCSSDLAGFAAVRALVERRPVPAPARPVALSPSAAGALPGEAIVVNRHGGPEQLHLAPIQSPRPGPGEVRLRQTAIGVNFIDVYCRTGAFDLLRPRSEEHTSELQSLMRISYAVFCLKKKNRETTTEHTHE